MRKYLTLMLPVVLAIPLTDARAQEKAAGEKAAVVAAIEHATAAWATAVKEGKYGDVVILYSDDAIVLPANGPAVKGRDQIREFWNGMAAFKPSDLKLTTVEYEIHGDIAVERGTYTMKVTPPGASEAVDDVGKYLVVWKKQADGSWKIYRDMFSTDLPQH